MGIKHRKIITKLICKIWLLFFAWSVSTVGFIFALTVILKYGIHP